MTVAIYVKHYVTSEGLEFLDKNWMPRVHAVMSIQEGFISLSSSQDINDSACYNIELQFDNADTMNKWTGTIAHAQLIEELNTRKNCRDRNYWHWARVETNGQSKITQPVEISWNKVVNLSLK